MTNHTALITDSTCDIPQSLIEQYSIIVQPHVLIWDSQQYRDRVDLQPEEFYRRLSTEKVLPTTSQASAQDFLRLFQSTAAGGAKEIVAIIVNSGFSGAILSAHQAAQESPVPVHVVDSRSATMGMGWQVLAAARAREAGGRAAEMIAAAEYVRSRVQLYVCLDTLDYVQRSGRIGNARRLAGSMLHVKPLIYVDHEAGTVETGRLSWTRKRSLQALYDSFFLHVNGNGRLRIAVLHGSAEADADELRRRVENERRPAELVTNITGSALGIHTGPGAVALCGYVDERPTAVEPGS